MRFYRSTDTNHQSRNIGSVFLVMCNLVDGLVPVSSLLLVRLLSSSATGSPCVPSVVTDVRWWCGCSVSAIPGSSCVWCSSTPRCVYLWRGSSCNCVSPRCPVCFALRSVSRRCCLCPLPPAWRPLNYFPPIPFLCCKFSPTPLFLKCSFFGWRSIILPTIRFWGGYVLDSKIEKWRMAALDVEQLCET